MGDVGRAFEAELNLRLARSRQTLDYAHIQRTRYSRLALGRMTCWDALELARESPRYAASITQFRKLRLETCARLAWSCSGTMALAEQLAAQLGVVAAAALA